MTADDIKHRDISMGPRIDDEDERDQTNSKFLQLILKEEELPDKKGKAVDDEDDEEGMLK